MNMDGDDMNKARAILGCRPGFVSHTLPSKGGLKFSRANGRPEEEERLKMYHDTQHKAISSLKVRKLGNLGTVKWHPDLHVAEIVKQGKFMQRVGRKHPAGFFALYAEEALFLLDVGDVELVYLGVALSLQEAFIMLLSSTPDSKLCTLEEYQVYAYLSKKFRVQRIECFFENEPCSSAGSRPKRKAKKKKSPSIDQTPDKQITNSQTKAPAKRKISECLDKCKKLRNDASFDEENNTKDEATRDWWFPEKNSEPFDLNKKVVKVKPLVCHIKCDVFIPSFAGVFKEITLPTLDESLLPNNTKCSQGAVPKLWWERIRRNDETCNYTLDYTCPKRVCYAKVARASKTWLQYKTLLLEAKENIINDVKRFHTTVFDQNVKPLLTLGDQAPTFDMKLKLSESNCQSVVSSLSTFNIRFNVFRVDNRPFRKTCPGEAFCKLVVTTLSVPSLADMLKIHTESDGIPVKIAVVNYGKIVFYSLDALSIPSAKP